MKLGKYELGSWRYERYRDGIYKDGYAWCRFAEVEPNHSEVCVAIYNWYSNCFWANDAAPQQRIEAHDSLVWEPFFHFRFQFLRPIYQKIYVAPDHGTLLMMTENEAKVAVDERLEKIASLLAFA